MSGWVGTYRVTDTFRPGTQSATIARPWIEVVGADGQLYRVPAVHVWPVTVTS